MNNPERRVGEVSELGPGAGQQPFVVAFVCTGNRVRSAVAAELLRMLGGADVRVSSYGTLDLGAIPALPQAVEAAARHGVDLSGHLTTPLASAQLASTDLVLGFERYHVSAAIIEAGAARARTFTLPELVELLRELDPEPQVGHGKDVRSRAAAVVARAAAARDERGRPARIPELQDPFGGRRSAYERSVENIVELCHELVAHLLG